VVVPAQGHPELSATGWIEPVPPEAPSSAVPVDLDVTTLTELDDATLADTDLTGAELDDLRLERVHLRTVSLTGADMPDATWRDVRCDACELSGLVAPKATMHRVELAHSRGMGLVLADTSAGNLRVVECRLDGANLRAGRYERCVFERSSLVEVDFSGAQLTEVVFSECDLTRAEFHDVRCDRVRFEHCTVDGLRGVTHLSGVTVTSDGVFPLALSAFAALGIVVDDPDDDT
jgi:uncharacterized protein YjbI with pentapeptide repeats